MKLMIVFWFLLFALPFAAAAQNGNILVRDSAGTIINAGVRRDFPPEYRDTTVVHFPPVIVTPTQATERLTPVTFSNLNQTSIAERYSVQDLPVLLSQLPSLTFYSENGNGIGYNYLRLRGFDQRRISVMINGIPQNDPEDQEVYWIDFPDLLGSAGNLQVQRGAGSAFYGPPAIGGSINLVTDPFTRKPGMTLETMFGFQQFGDSSASLPLNTRKYSATINSGLVNDHYMFYGRLGQILSDGYRANSWADLNSYFLGAVRVDDAMTTRIHFYGGPVTDGLAYEGVPKFAKDNLQLRRQNYASLWDYTTGAYAPVLRRPQETESFSQPHYELLNEWRISPVVTLANTFFFVSGDGYFDYDPGSYIDTAALHIGYRYGVPTVQNPANMIVRAFVGNKQGGWLPRVQMNFGRDALTLGAEVRIHRSDHWGRLQYAENLPPNFNPDYHFYSYNGAKNIFSFYAHNLHRLDENTTVMTDIQFISSKYGIDNDSYNGFNFTYPSFFVNPHAGINRNFSREWNGYLSVGYTSREPVLGNLYSAESAFYGETPQFQSDTINGIVRYDFTKPLVHPEHLLDIEAGTGYRSGSALFTANVYWMEFQDELVENGLLDIWGNPLTRNADRSRHIGIEFEGSYDIANMLSVSGNATFSSNRLVRYTEYDNNVPVSLDGNPIAGFPDQMWNLRLAYHPAPITVSLNLRFVGGFFTDNTKDPQSYNESYTVANADILYNLPQIAGTQFTLRGEINNILNTLYFDTGLGSSFYPAAERNFLVGLTTKF